MYNSTNKRTQIIYSARKSVLHFGFMTNTKNKSWHLWAVSYGAKFKIAILIADIWSELSTWKGLGVKNEDTETLVTFGLSD